MSKYSLISASLALCLLLVAGCSLPRIIVLEDPLTPEEHINLGVAYEEKGDLDAALREYEAAAKKSSAAYLYLGNISVRTGDLDKAEQYYRRAIESDPRSADAHNNLAWVYFLKRDNLDEAERLAATALELNPQKKAIYLDTFEKIKTLKTSPR